MGCWKDANEVVRHWPRRIRVAAVFAALGSLALTTFVVLSLVPPRVILRIETDPPGAEVWMGEYGMTRGSYQPTPLQNPRLLGPSPQEVEIPLKRHPLFWRRVLSRVLPIPRPPGAYGGMGNYHTVWPLGAVALVGLHARDWLPEAEHPAFRFSVEGRPVNASTKTVFEPTTRGFSLSYRAVLKVRFEPVHGRGD